MEENNEIWKKNADFASVYDILDSVQEECSELIQACSKYKRANGHGLPTTCPVEKATDMLIEETSHVQRCCELLIYKLNLNIDAIKEQQLAGDEKIYNRFLKQLEGESNV